MLLADAKRLAHLKQKIDKQIIIFKRNKNAFGISTKRYKIIQNKYLIKLF